MSMIGSQVLDPGVQLPDLMFNLGSVAPTLLFTGKGTLGSTKLRKYGF